MARKRLGEVLLEDGLIDQEDLEEALRYKEKSGYRLGTALVALRIIAEWQLTEALGKALEMQVVDLGASQPTQAALRLIPARLAERFDLIPLQIKGRGRNRRLVIAMSDPLNRPLVKRMRDVAGCDVVPVLASLSAIQRSIRRHYHGAERSQGVAKAERLRSNADEAAGVLDSLEEMREQTRQITISQLRRELEQIDQRPPGDLPAPPVGDLASQPSLALELKFRALLHLLVKKQVVDGREYAEALHHLIDAVSVDDK